jgi:DNA-binding beta-propeller fold protein YncE
MRRPTSLRPTRRVVALVGASVVAAAAAVTVSLSSATASPRVAAVAPTVTSSTVVTGRGPSSVAVDATQHEAFVASLLSATTADSTGGTIDPAISVISTTTGAFLRSLKAPAVAPEELAVDPTDKVLFVAGTHVTGSFPSDPSSVGEIQVVSEATGAPVRTPAAPDGIVKLPGSTFPLHLAVDSTAGLLFATTAGNTQLAVVNIKTLLAKTAQPTSAVTYPSLGAGNGGPFGFDIAVDPVTAKVYVSNGRPDPSTVTGSPPASQVYDVLVVSESHLVAAKNKTVSGITSIAMPGAPFDLAVDPTLGVVWATVPTQGLVAEIKGSAVVATVQTGGFPEGVSVDPTTGTVFVSDEEGGTYPPQVQPGQPVPGPYLGKPTEVGAYAIAESTDRVVDQYKTLTQPVSLAVDPLTHLVVIADSADQTVSIVQGPQQKTAATPVASSSPPATPTTPRAPTPPTTSEPPTASTEPSTSTPTSASPTATEPPTGESSTTPLATGPGEATSTSVAPAAATVTP